MDCQHHTYFQFRFVRLVVEQVWIEIVGQVGCRYELREPEERSDVRGINDMRTL
jgi:hypothetical protein